jgi:hypothetical protein
VLAVPGLPDKVSLAAIILQMMEVDLLAAVAVPAQWGLPAPRQLVVLVETEHSLLLFLLQLQYL